MKRSLLLISTLFIALAGKADITVGDNQLWWGYFSDSDASSLPIDNGYLGYSSSIALDVAIRIPANDEFLSGCTIKGIRFWLGGDISAIKLSPAPRLWIGTSLPARTTASAAQRQTIQSSTLVKGLNEVELNTPFEINGQELYVGFSFTISKKAYPIMAGGTEVPDGFFFRTGGTGDWTDFYGSDYGNLALQLLVEAEEFPTNRVSVRDFGQKMLYNENSVTFPITITNKGTNSVSSISYVTGTVGDDSTSEEVTKTFNTSPIALNGTKTYNITFPVGNEAKKYENFLTVTKVNGEPNTAIQPSGKGFVINLPRKEPVTPVIEEFTGTWCGWCPRGMVGMEKVHETYGDQVVQIAAHNGDIMSINAYQDVISTYTDGFPNSITDRQFEADPSFSSLKSALTKAWNRVASGTIKLFAQWKDATKRAVIFTTKTTFSYRENDGKYSIALILTEDGLKGTSSDWAQQNYYNGQSSSGDMAWWGTAGSPVTGLEFNHVAGAAWGALNGIDGSVSPEIEADIAQEFTYTTGTISTSLIQDKTKLKAIALLIDRITGTIVNAAQTYIEDDATSISSVPTEADVPAARYAIDGRMLSTPQKGINIIRMTDGTVKKVLTK